MADITGDNGNNTLEGTDDNDLIQGLGGDDVINGNGGDDRIEGGFGRNTLTGGAGNDVFAIVGRGFQVHTITDFTTGEDRVDLSFLNIGSFDQLIPFLTQDGNNATFSSQFNDETEQFVFQNLDRGDLSAADFIFNTDTTDLTVDTTGSFNSRNNTLFGGLGNDTLIGNGSDDTMSGGDGNDIFQGGFGRNTLYLGNGNDTVDYTVRGFQVTTVKDFEQGDDVIDVSFLNVSTFEDLLLFLSQDGDDVVLQTRFNDDAEITRIEDFDLADLEASDFVFNTSTDGLTVDIGNGFASRDYTLFGGAGNDTITSANGNDILVAGAGDDLIDGGFFTNTIYTGTGNDTVLFADRGTHTTTIKDFDVASDRIDVRTYNVADLETLLPYLTQDGDDVVLETVANDQTERFIIEDVLLEDLTTANFRFNTFAADLDVGIGNGFASRNYVLFGGNGDDDITSANGDDELNGGAGNDDLSAGFGTNILRGGEGDDDFLFDSRGSQVTTVLDFTIGEDRLDVRGLNVADLKTLGNRLTQTEDGVQLRTVFNGSEEIFLLQGIQLADLSESDFRFNTNNATLNVDGTTRNDVLFGGNGDDVINADRGNDFIQAGAGSDELNGGSGDDFLQGGAGTDTLNGGDGNDVADYTNNTVGIVADLGSGVITGGDADGDVLNSIEGVQGTEFADVITGTDEANVLRGRGGDDVIDGLDGNNTIVGGDGNDVITAGNGNNDIEGGTGNDSILIGDGASTVSGGEGDDVITLGDGRSDVTGGEGSDTITVGADANVEAGDGDDVITLATNADETRVTSFLGGAGDDLISIGSANLVIVNGGEGTDTLAIDSLIALGTTFNGALVATYTEPENFLQNNSREIVDVEILRIGVGDDARDFAIDSDNFVATADNAQFTEAGEVIQTRSSIFSDDSFIVSAGGGDDFILGTSVGNQIFGQSGNDIIQGFGGDDQLFGDDFSPIPSNTIESQVFRAYQAVFDRAPDEGGFNAFVAEVRLGRLTQEQVITDFVTSPEFAALYGELTNREFVEQLYRNVLDREGDADGINAFTAALDDGASRAAVVIDFANSPEFIANTQLSSAAFANTVVINPVEGDVYRAYQGVFGRDPDLGGFELFTSAIAIGVLDIEGVVTDFVGSPEFQDTYGSLSNTNFVELLYDNVLPGNEDPVGRAAFVDALDSGALTRPQVVVQFIQSFEFRQATDAAAEEFARNIFDAVGNDILDGGVGDDTLFGGRGDDLFVTGNGADTILDFTVGEDRIDLTFLGEVTDTFAEIMLGATQEGLNTLLDYGNGNTVLLNNVTMTDLTEGDFVLPPAAGTAQEPPKAEAPVIAEAPTVDAAVLPLGLNIEDWMFEDLFL